MDKAKIILAFGAIKLLAFAGEFAKIIQICDELLDELIDDEAVPASGPGS